MFLAGTVAWMLYALFNTKPPPRPEHGPVAERFFPHLLGLAKSQRVLGVDSAAPENELVAITSP